MEPAGLFALRRDAGSSGWNGLLGLVLPAGQVLLGLFGLVGLLDLGLQQQGFEQQLEL